MTSFASNVARMETVFFCAEKIGRHISLVGRSMQRIYKAARQCGYLQNVIEPLDPRDAKNLARDKIVYLCTGSQGEPMGALNRISNFTHPDVFIEKDDTVIFSSKIIPGNVSVVEESQSIKDRKNLSANGYIEVTIMITPKGSMHKRPVLTFRGIPVDDTEEFVYGLEDVIEDITRTFKLGSKQQEHNLIDALKIACRKFSKEKTGKKPFTNINLVRI